ncbi:MAG: hypothetical protein WD070_04950 [Pirellulaceae bacterium]
MIDTFTGKPIYVSTEGEGGPYIMVQLTQLEPVRNALSAGEISFWVDENAISLNGEPEVAVINLSRSVDIEDVQKILNAVS